MQDPNERRVIQEERVQTPTGVDAAVVENRVQVVPTPAEQKLATLERAKQIVWFIIGLIIAVLALRFVLLALGANPASGFANFIYGLSDIFVRPFWGIFGNETQPQPGVGIFEMASLIAMAVYLLVGWIINRLLEIVLAPPTPPTY